MFRLRGPHKCPRFEFHSKMSLRNALLCNWSGRVFRTTRGPLCMSPRMSMVSSYPKRRGEGSHTGFQINRQNFYENRSSWYGPPRSHPLLASPLHLPECAPFTRVRSLSLIFGKFEVNCLILWIFGTTRTRINMVKKCMTDDYPKCQEKVYDWWLS